MPEAEVGALPPVDGLDADELGCGTGYVSAWLAGRGARPIGLDVSENQLATARAMQGKYRLKFPLHRASAEDVPLPGPRGPRRQRILRVPVARSRRVGERKRRGSSARAARSCS